MRTTINIPDGLLADLDHEFGGQPKTRIICEALEQYIKQKRREKLLKLRGKLSLKDLSSELEDAELEDTKRLGRKLHNN